MHALIPQRLIAPATSIKAVVFDVDGVLTDSKIIYDDQGNEFKHFHVKDGFMIKLLMKEGLQVGAITGRDSPVVKYRLNELGLDFHYHGSKDKREHFRQILKDNQLQPHEVAYIGDDWPDLPVLLKCGLSCAPADADHFVKEQVDWILQAQGGEGAVREMGEGILSAQGKLQAALDRYFT